MGRGEKQGNRAVFGFDDLERLVATKQLVSDSWSLSNIATLTQSPADSAVAYAATQTPSLEGHRFLGASLSVAETVSGFAGPSAFVMSACALESSPAVPTDARAVVARLMAKTTPAAAQAAPAFLKAASTPITPSVTRSVPSSAPTSVPQALTLEKLSPLEGLDVYLDPQRLSTTTPAARAAALAQIQDTLERLASSPSVPVANREFAMTQLALSPATQSAQPGQPFDVVVRLDAPPAAPSSTARPRLNLALVIDRSGSMAGAPLEHAKQAATDLVRRLEAGDQVCLVAYGALVELLAEPMDAVQGRDALIGAIARLTAGGGTPLRAGWLAGAQALAPHVSKFGLSRVLLLSDGQATDGSTPSGLADEARELAAAGIGTSTYGLGFNFNETLMTELARGGQGQAFYAESAEELIPYFTSEFAMLADTVGKAVTAKLHVTLGGKPVPVVALETLADVAPAGHPLPALMAGSASWAAFRVQVPAGTRARQLDLSATVTWQDMAGTTHHRAQALGVAISKAAPAPGLDTWALARLQEVNAARLQREALAQVARGQWDLAGQTLTTLQAGAVGNAYVAGVADNLQTLLDTSDQVRFSKEALYASNTMVSRSVGSGELAASQAGDKYGLRKAMQGKAVPAAPETPSSSTTGKTP